MSATWNDAVDVCKSSRGACVEMGRAGGWMGSENLRCRLRSS